MPKRDDRMRSRVVIRNAKVGGHMRIRSTTSVTVENSHAEGDIRVEVENDAAPRVPLDDEETIQIARRESKPGFFQIDFHRDSVEGKVGGVCAGLGNDFNINPLWFRILFITIFMVGPGFVLYVLAWILLPDKQLPPRQAAKVLPPDRDEVPQELRDAWREVNEITKN